MMGIYTANLKFFYQRPALWVVYAIAGMFYLFNCTLSLHYPSDLPFSGVLFSVIFIQGYLGMIVGSLWRETLGKPLSFCLPRNQTIPAPILVIAGTLTNLILILVYFFVALAMGHPPYHHSLIFVSVFFSGISFFWVGALVVLQFHKVSSHLPLLIWVYILLFFPSMSPAVEIFLLSHPFTLMALGISLGTFTWFRLKRRNFGRWICLNPSRSILSSWDQPKMNKFQELSTAKKKAVPFDEWQREKLENFFLDRMKQPDALRIGRFLWGWFYQIFGNPERRVLGTLFFVAIWAFCLPASSTWTVFIMVPALALGIPLPLTQSQLLPVGRTELFRTVIRLQITYAFLFMAVLLVLGVLLQGLSYVVPQFTMAGHTFTFMPFQWGYFYLPVFIIPIVFLIRGIAISFSTIVATGLLVAAVLPWFFLYRQLSEYLPWLFVVVGTLCWPLCFLVYRYYFRRANLTS